MINLKILKISGLLLAIITVYYTGYINAKNATIAKYQSQYNKDLIEQQKLVSKYTKKIKELEVSHYQNYLKQKAELESKNKELLEVLNTSEDACLKTNMPKDIVNILRDRV